MSKTIQAPATAKDVRAWFAEFPALVPTEAEQSIAGRGRLHPSAVEVYNEASGREYIEGTAKHVPLEHFKISKSGARLRRVAMVPEKQVRTLAGPHAGKRGRLSAAAMSHASEVYTKQVNGLK